MMLVIMLSSLVLRLVAFMLYDESGDQLIVQGASADATTSSGKLLLSTSLTDINDGDVLGRIDFKAPLEGRWNRCNITCCFDFR